MVAPLFGSVRPSLTPPTPLTPPEPATVAAKTDNDRTGDISLTWGYNRAAFTPSTLTLQGPGHSMRLQDVRASDRPGISSALDLINTVAQYNARLSVQIAPALNLSFGMDHMKYVMDWDQTVAATGHIDPSASARFAGTYRNTPIKLGGDDSFLGNFEHTNGLNLVDLELAWTHDLYTSKYFALSTRLGGAVGIVIPKSDVTLFGTRLDNVFHVAGYGLAATATLHAEIARYFFVEARVKAGVLDLPDILTVGGHAQQTFGYVEPMVSLGVNIPVGEWLRR